MLITGKVSAALEVKRSALQDAVARNVASLERYGQELDRLSTLSAAQLRDEFGGVPWPGALPTDEWDRHGLVVACNLEWPTAQDARAWALKQLQGIPTVAVDGSQISPSKEYGVPISLVQIAWFCNPHDASQPYVKDVRNEVVTPGDPPEEISEYAFAEARVNRCRFVLEMAALQDALRTLSPRPVPVVFHDGSFVLSFTGRMLPSARGAYLHPLFRILDASRECEIPVVGYVDASLASDLVTMVRTAGDLSPAGIVDAQLLVDRMATFDRTTAFRCARGDILPHYLDGERDYAEDVYFVYLKTGRDRLPARIDFPGWIIAAGLLDLVIDVIRAEIVVGGGYPYALETADAAAVLTTQDRLAFYRLWQVFAEDAGLGTRVPAKTVSKGHRR